MTCWLLTAIGKIQFVKRNCCWRRFLYFLQCNNVYDLLKQSILLAIAKYVIAIAEHSTLNTLQLQWYTLLCSPIFLYFIYMYIWCFKLLFKKDDLSWQPLYNEFIFSQCNSIFFCFFFLYLIMLWEENPGSMKLVIKKDFWCMYIL